MVVYDGWGFRMKPAAFPSDSPQCKGTPASDLTKALSAPSKDEGDVPVGMRPSSEPLSQSLGAATPSDEPNSTCTRREAADTTFASDSSQPLPIGCSSPLDSAYNPPKREALEAENDTPSDNKKAEGPPTQIPQHNPVPTVQKQFQHATAPPMFHPPSFPVPRWPIQSMPPQPPPPGLFPIPQYTTYEMPYGARPYYGSLPYPPNAPYPSNPQYPYWCAPFPATHLMGPPTAGAYTGAPLWRTPYRYVSQTQPVRYGSHPTSTAGEALTMSGREGGAKSTSNEGAASHGVLPVMKEDSVHDGDAEKGTGSNDITSSAAHESMDAPEHGHRIISLPAGYSDAESYASLEISVQSVGERLAYVCNALQPVFEARREGITESQPAHSTVDEDHSGKVVRPKETQKKSDMVTTIKSILDRHPDGVSIPDFMKSFEEEYGQPLDFVKLGYSSMEFFVVANHNLFSYEKRSVSDGMILFAKVVQPSAEVSLRSDWAPSFKYKPPVIPELDSQVRVRIVDLVNPGLLWIQLEDTVPRLDELMRGLNDFYSKKTGKANSLPPQLVVPGLAVAVLFKDTCQWHRARVECRDGDDVLVFYVDYGTTEMLKLSELRILDQQFREDPLYAVRASLANLCPPAGKKVWPAEAHDFLIENCCEVPLIASVHSRNLDDPDNPSIELFLYLTEKIDGQIFINDILLQRKLASLKTVKPAQEVRFRELECDPSFKYKPPFVPEVFSEVQVKIVEGLDPNHFWVHLESFETEFTDLMCEINRLYFLKKEEDYYLPPHLAVPGLAVAVLFKETAQWHRARIQSCKGDNIEVYYVDYGTSETVRRNELWKLDRRLGEKPMYALRASLANLCAPIESKDWPIAACELLFDTNLGAVLVASVHKRNLDDPENPSVEVFLYSVDSSGQRECLNEALLKKKLASLKPGIFNLYEDPHPINYDALRLLLPVWFTTSKSGHPLDLDTTIKNLKFCAEWPHAEYTDPPEEPCCLRHLVQSLFASNPKKLCELWCFIIKKFEDRILQELCASVEAVLEQWGVRYADLKALCPQLMDHKMKTEEEGKEPEKK